MAYYLSEKNYKLFSDEGAITIGKLSFKISRHSGGHGKFSISPMLKYANALISYGKIEYAEKLACEALKAHLEQWPFHNHDYYYETVALTSYLLGNIARSAVFYQKYCEGENSFFSNALITDESTRLAYAPTINFDLDVRILPKVEVANMVIRRKGIVLDSLLEDRAVAQNLKSNPLAQRSLENLNDLRKQSSRIAFSQKPEDIKNFNKQSDTIAAIEKDLAKYNSLSGKTKESSRIDLTAVMKNLSNGEAFLDFFEYHIPQIPPLRTARLYGCIVIYKNKEPQLISIPEADIIDKHSEILKNAISNGNLETFNQSQKDLTDILVDPIFSKLPVETKKLFIAPYGKLNFLSFSSLFAKDGSFLAEHYDIAYVGSGRDLARKVTISDSKSIVLFADPVFDYKASAFSTNALALRSGEVDEFGKIVLPPLPGTRAEEAVLEEVAKSGGWSPEPKLGEAANKSAIENLKSPGILHLATHGFYLNTLPQGGDGERGMKVMEAPDLSANKPAPLPKIDPMHASGIALTGAQATLKAWSEGRVPNPSEDGILTAEEVGALNLDGTWLVTLSACETGVGEARSGEGVFGLRRAFMMAGAQNLLMTLWPVSDEVTPKIMADFYKEALATHDAAGSLAKVQRDWLVKLRKEKGLLAAVRDAGPFAMVVMAKQDSTFSSSSTATPMTGPQAPTSAGVAPESTSTNQPVFTNTPALPEAVPSPSFTPKPTEPEALVPASTPTPSPLPSATPDASPMLIEQAPLKKAA
ncbi:MAG: CHAT domain-containing protein [Proteobacteria bacterium]|nr:CHAT domain-containing protein [Pseudomonadota bacterium]